MSSLVASVECNCWVVGNRVYRDNSAVNESMKYVGRIINGQMFITGHNFAMHKDLRKSMISTK